MWFSQLTCKSLYRAFHHLPWRRCSPKIKGGKEKWRGIYHIIRDLSAFIEQKEGWRSSHATRIVISPTRSTMMERRRKQKRGDIPDIVGWRPINGRYQGDSQNLIGASSLIVQWTKSHRCSGFTLHEYSPNNKIQDLKAFLTLPTVPCIRFLYITPPPFPLSLPVSGTDP